MSEHGYLRHQFFLAYDDGCRRCEADLRHFRGALDVWLDQLLLRPLQPNWREQLTEFLSEQEVRGYRVENRWVLEEEIEYNARERGLLAEDEPQSARKAAAVVQLARHSATRQNEQDNGGAGKEELQEREFRWFAREVSIFEQRRLGLTDEERLEYERYLLNAQRSQAIGEPVPPAPSFYLDKKAQFDEQKAISDRNTPTLRPLNLSRLELEIRELTEKLRHPEDYSDRELQAFATKLLFLLQEQYYSSGDWNFFTRTIDRLLNPAWDGTGTINDIAIGLGGFAGGAPGLGPRRAPGAQASPARRRERPSGKPRSPARKKSGKIQRRQVRPAPSRQNSDPSPSTYRARFLRARPNLPTTWVVHHSLPQMYRELLRKVGVNVDELRHLRGIDVENHKDINSKWQEFHVQKGGNPTPKDVIDHARKIDKEYRDTFIFPDK